MYKHMIYTTHETYETLLMKHELHEWNITYATYETLPMQHMNYNSPAHAHE
jgi:hypothetical protein